jgi:hypothetical protein
MRIFNPQADVAGVRVLPAAPLGVLRGGCIVVLDNNKPNARALLGRFADEIARRFGAAEVRIERKRSPSEPAPDDLLERVALQGALVVTGTAD